MKTPKEKILMLTIFVFIAQWLFLQFALTYASDCFKCHQTEKFKGKVIHQPVKENKCAACHSPHVAKHKGLLKIEEAKLCFQCHESIEEKVSQSKFLHQPVKDGSCVKCHSPHAAEYSDLMDKDIADGCLSCHKKNQKGYDYPHQPYEKGQCNSCHDPHGAPNSNLIKKTAPSLCLDCHKKEVDLKKRHLNKDLFELNCLSCHNPHGSKESSLVRSVRHAPFAKRDCNVCHEKPNQIRVCLDCHPDTISSFYKSQSHVKGNGIGNPCANCHTPHAADRSGLLYGAEGEACRACHEDTFKRREKTLYKHSEWSTCTHCHSVHGADQLPMLKDEPDKVCAGCHEKHINFVHPIGDKAIDRRNGKPMNCISCHDPCTGTMFKAQLRGSSGGSLCRECHIGY